MNLARILMGNDDPQLRRFVADVQAVRGYAGRALGTNTQVLCRLPHG